MVVTGAAGRVAVVQASGEGEITVVSHAPGGTWSAPRTLLSSATSEDGALGTDGTVAARTAAGRATVARVSADGALAGPVEGAVPAGTNAIATGSSSDGSALVALTDSDDNLVLYRAAGTALTAVGTRGIADVLGAEVSDAAIVSTGPGRFVVVWAQGSESGNAQVRTATVNGTSVVSGSANRLSAAFDPSVSVDAVAVAAAGGDAVAGWIAVDSSTGSRNAQVRSATRVVEAVQPVVLNSDVAAEYLDLATSRNEVVAVWGGTFRGVTSGAATTLDGAGVRRCDVPHDLARAFAFAGRDGAEIAGTGSAAAGSPLTRLSVAGCAAGARTMGSAIERVPVVTGGVDAEGSLVTLLGSAGDPSSLYVDDVAGPTVRSVSVPDTVDAGAAFGVGAVLTDAWSLPASVRWTVDGADAGTGSTLGPLTLGDHTVGGTARDALGNVTPLPGRVTTAKDTSSPPPPPPATPPVDVPAAPPVDIPAAPPVDVPVPPGSGVTPVVDPPSRETKRKVAPRVLSARLVSTDRGWRMRARVRGALRLRFRLFREGKALRRPSRCGTPLARHAPSGRQGGRVVGASGTRVDVAVTSAMARALRRRGRYTLVVRVYGPQGRASPKFVTRRTVC